MQLTPEIFQCHTEAIAGRVEASIREHAERMRRRGVAVGLSGGVDSSVVATLCARAVGPQKVHGLILREKRGNPDAERYARVVAGHLGIRTEVTDISPVLSKLGVYRFVTGLLPSRKLAGRLVRRYMAAYEGNPYLDHKKGVDRPLIHRGFAMINAQHRVRLVYAYRYVEQHNLMLVGCSHRSESLLGLFVKFGIDDCADLMPLGGVYRSHVLRLAQALEVPAEIISRPPSPDVVPGIEDKYRDVLGLDSQTVDLILVGLEAGLGHRDIAARTGAGVEEVAELSDLVERTYHMRHTSISPQIPDSELWGPA